MDLKLSPFQQRALGILLALTGIVLVLGVAGLIAIDRKMREQF